MKIKAFADYKSDEKLEDEGVWSPMADGVDFKIRRLRSKIVEKARERIYGPHERALGPRKKSLPDGLETQLTIQLLAQAVIVDWKGPGMVDDDGKAIPFTVENCAEVISDADTGKDIRAAVLQYGMDGEHYAPTSKEAVIDEGNSQTS